MMDSNAFRKPVKHSLRKAQDGVVLFIALIVLVAMTLAGIAVMRSVDTNVLIAGNLAFRNAATSAGDANWQDTFNPTTFNWTANSTLVGTDSNGNEIRYIVHRMCAESAKTVDGTDCFKVSSGSSGSTKGGGSYGVTPLSGATQPYFRITARVEGPRNSVSYVQAFIY